MNTGWQSVNTAADLWVPLVGQAAWQALLVGLLVLLVVRLGSKWPSPIRYTLLLLALLKFVTPPLLDLPTGVFSLVTIERSDVSTGTAVTVPFAAPLSDGLIHMDDWRLHAQMSPLDAPPGLQLAVDPTEASSSGDGRTIMREQFSHSQGDPSSAERDATKNSGIDRSQTAQTLDRSSDEPATREAIAAAAIQSERTSYETPSLFAGLLLLHLSGAGLLLMVAAWRAVRLRRSINRMSEADPHMRKLTARLAAELRLCRVPVLKLSTDDVYPYSFGLLRPVIVLSERDLARLTDEERRTVLSHELAHHRRGDLWVNTFQLFVAVIWWFHPVVWLLNRNIRITREDCCDDLLLSRRLVADDSYCQTLLSVAEAGPGVTKRIPALTVSMADGPHPLSARIDRIMDERIPKLDRLRWWMTAALVLTALVVLPGLRAAEPEGRQTTSIVVIEGTEPVVSSGPQQETRQSDKSASQTPADSLLAQADTPIPREWPREVQVRVLKDELTPVADALVILKVDDNEQAFITDERGTVTLTLPTDLPRWLRITVDIEPFVPMRAVWRPELRPERVPPEELMFRLKSGGVGGGRVIDAEGRPIAGVQGSVEYSIDRTRSQPVRPSTSPVKFVTDEEGRWSVSRVPAAVQEIRVKLIHEEYLSDLWGQELTESERDEFVASRFERVLQKGVPLVGQVTDPDGKPVGGATVQLGAHASFEDRVTNRTTDAEGRYRYHSVKPGVDLLTVIKPGLAPTVDRITLGDGENSHDVELQEGHTIRIRVTNPDGTPVVGAKVIPDTWKGTRTLWTAHKFHTTDNNGVWTWTWAPADEVLYDVYERTHLRIQNVTLQPRDEPHELTMLPQLVITGSVVDDETGEPVKTFSVTSASVRKAGSLLYNWRDSKSRDRQNGAFVYTEDSPSEHGHVMRVTAAGYLPSVSREFQDEEGEVELEFRLRKGEDITGIVLTPEGEPESGANVILGTIENRPYVRANGESDQDRGLSLETDAAGRFEFPPESSAYTVYVFADSGFAMAEAKEFQDAGEDPLRLTVKPWARVEGELRVSGTQLPGEKVELEFTGEMGGQSFFGPHIFCDFDAVADREGRFVFEQVPPDTEVTVFHTVVIRFPTGSSNGRGHSSRFKLENSQTQQITLGGEGRTIVGRVKLAPEANVETDWESNFGHLSPLDEDGQAAVTNAPPTHFRVRQDGSFRIPDLPTGRYKLVLRAKTKTLDAISRHGELIGRVAKVISVPVEDAGDEDTPVDVGEFTIHPKKEFTARAGDEGAARDEQPSRAALSKPTEKFHLRLELADSGGQPVAGAQVRAWFALDGGAEQAVWTADDEGVTVIDAAPSYGAWLFINAEGFRFHGTYVDQSVTDLSLMLTRSDEQPRDPPLHTLDALEPSDEVRRHGRDALREFARAVMQSDQENLKSSVERLLSQHDPEFALTLHEENTIEFAGFTQDPDRYRRWHDSMIRVFAARKLAATDLARAEEIMATINDPQRRTWALSWAAEELAQLNRAQATRWLQQARALIDDISESTERAVSLAMIGQVWHEMGDDATALEVLRQGVVEARKPSDHEWIDYSRAQVAWTLAPLDLSAALDLVPIPLDAELPDEETVDELRRKMGTARGKEREQLKRQARLGFRHARYYSNIAHNIADVNPAESERLLMALEPKSRNWYAMRVCYRMASVDLARAKRIAQAVDDPIMRAFSLGVIADAIAETDNPQARLLIQDAYQLLIENPRAKARIWNSTTVALGLLRSVERVDPSLLRELIWRTIALRVNDSEEESPGVPLFGSVHMAEIAVGLIARYDRDLARHFTLSLKSESQNWSSLERPTFLPGALTTIDPEGAIEAVIRMPHDTVDRRNVKLEAWKQILFLLDRNPEERWNWITDDHLHQWSIDNFDL